MEEGREARRGSWRDWYGPAASRSRGVQRLLYGVSATDPITLIAVSLVLLLVGAIASYVPALKATRVDQMMALRSD
jgi:ABC-type lipoprotein release transport system permease subunit